MAHRLTKITPFSAQGSLEMTILDTLMGLTFWIGVNEQMFGAE
jgi:hypothetical protein